MDLSVSCDNSAVPLQPHIESHWNVVYTRPRHEKSVAQELSTLHIEHILPLYKKSSRWKDRVAKVLLPLFPGYVFVRTQSDSRCRVLQLPGVVRYVSFQGNPVVMCEGEIELLKTCAKFPERIVPSCRKFGERVRVRDGVFAGIVGTLQREANGDMLVVSVEQIDKSFALYVHGDDLEPA